MKKVVALMVKVAVSGGLLYLILRRQDMAAFWHEVSSISIAALITAILIFALTQCLSAYRWSFTVRKDMEVSYRELLSIYFIGMFFNNFLPTIVGGDVVKGYYLYRKTDKGGAVFASILMDRYSGFTALMAITLVAVIAGYGLIVEAGGMTLVAIFAGLIGFFILVSAFLWVEPLHGWLVKLLGRVHMMGLNKKIDAFYKVFIRYKGHKGLFGRIFLLSLIIQGSVIIGYVVLARGMGIDVNPLYFFLFVPLAATASMVPFSLSGLGIRELVFVILFVGVGVGEEQIVGLSLLWFFTVVVTSLYGAIEYVRMGGKKRIEAVVKEAEAKGY